MAAGLVNLVVRYSDVLTGRGVPVDSLRGRLFNAMGAAKGEIVPTAKSDVDGVYYEYEDLDVHDPAVYPGTYLMVEWLAERYGVTLPTFPKKYDFVPAYAFPANKTVVIWKNTGCSPFLFYEVWRRRSFEPDVFVGRSFGPSIVDSTVFVNEFEARSWKYVVKTAVHADGALQPDGTDINYQEYGGTPTVLRTDLAVCSVEGRIVDLMGRPYFSNQAYDKSIVGFRQYEKDRHQVVGNVYILPEEVVVQTTELGQFSVILIQDVLAEIWVPSSRFRARFAVPKKDVAGLGDLNFQILHE